MVKITKGSEEMKKIRIAVKTVFSICLVLSIGVFASFFAVSGQISDSYKVTKGQPLEIASNIPVTAEYNGLNMSQSTQGDVGEIYDVDLKLFGVIPYSTAKVEIVDEMYVSVLGNPFGMKIYTDGVLVIELSGVVSGGKTLNPAKKAGLKVGDYIKTVNGKKISGNEELSELVQGSIGSEMKLEIIRDKQNLEFTLTPVKSDEDGAYHAGIWVRDSSAGIGTLTFYSPADNIVCGLGHGICDSDTGKLLTLDCGELVEASIVGVSKGENGNPGELKGKFGYSVISDIKKNCESGVYGTLKGNVDGATLTEIALKQEIKDGAAQVLCTVDGNKPKLYSCEIKKRTANYRSSTQNLTVKITDPELLSVTGGIVQGMSGSPIIQNGKLIGALTHVLIDDPKTGYGIFAENMLKEAQTAAETNELKKAS